MDENRRLQPDIISQGTSASVMIPLAFPIMSFPLDFLQAAVSRISLLCNLVSGFIVFSCFAVFRITRSYHSATHDPTFCSEHDVGVRFGDLIREPTFPSHSLLLPRLDISIIILALSFPLSYFLSCFASSIINICEIK